VSDEDEDEDECCCENEAPEAPEAPGSRPRAAAAHRHEAEQVVLGGLVAQHDRLPPGVDARAPCAPGLVGSGGWKLGGFVAY